ncbi:Juvenile hormone epoxide hydrolase [Papilio xuthus]|nr:Juvenile hormone epoxide hydrolase [Papilio xuthus]
MNEYWGPNPNDLTPDLEITPFKIEFSDVMIHDLRERLLHCKSSASPPEQTGFTYGFNTNFLTRVLDFWKNNYNFKDREQFFNKYKHFKTKIQGLDIHFIHVKPDAKDITVVPLLMIHGWPGSVREFYEVIPILTKPMPRKNFVFELVIPSLPGFGFSQGAFRPGLTTTKMAVVMLNLMKRLGYGKFYVQGGDIGHYVGSAMATMFPNYILGFHTNFPTLMYNQLATLCIYIGSAWPRILVEAEFVSRLYPYSQQLQKLRESGFLQEEATKPDTMAAALSDSPAGLAAYILEKFAAWTNPEYKNAGDGKLLDKFSLTSLLDNVMVYWVTNSVTTSLRAYAEIVIDYETHTKFDEITTKVPTWGIKFKHDLLFHPDLLLTLKYRNYHVSTVVDDGGHFAAFENPTIMGKDIYSAVATFRRFQQHVDVPTDYINYETATSVHEFTVKDIYGETVKLDKYKGYVLVIVNIASQCGLTDTNYKQLNELHEKYATTKNLRILAFPCNQFGKQEPGTSKDILNFAKEKDVKFDLFEKIEVNGPNAHPLYKFLKKMQAGTFGDYIKWNFSKFIIDKNGVPVERLGPNVYPLDMEPLLAKYW